MNNKTIVLIFSLSVFLVGLLGASIHAQTIEPTIKTELETGSEKPMDLDSLKSKSPIVQTNKDGVAIDGYDPVAYFDQGKAVRGQQSYNCEYLGRQWHFSSAENRDKFLANPEKFAPQYGGYCAHSIGNNKLVRSNPKSFAINDGKLHLYVNNYRAQKDKKKDKIKFEFDKKVRDNNWLTYQSEF